MKKSSCVVRNCESTGIQDPELTFFNFPKNDSLRKKWLEVLSMYDDQLNKRSKVCSKHFKKLDCDVKTINYTIGGKQTPDPNKKICEWKSLKPEAVPSLNLPAKSTFKIKISKKDNSKEIKVEEVKIKDEKVKPQTKMHKKQSVEVLPRPRTQSRRAASKEALKQMQLLLDDEDDTVEIPDDDVAPVEPSPPPPPKKKYKLSHRKSSDGNDRDVIVLKSITNRNAQNTLELDCWVEQLEEVQKNRIKKMQDEEKEMQEKLDSLIKSNNVKVIHKGDLTTAIEVTEYVQNAITAAQTPPQPIILNNNITGAPQSYQLVVDPRLGLIVGAVNPTGNTSPSATTASPKVYQGKVQVAQNLQQTRSQNVPQTRSPNIAQSRTQNVAQTRAQNIQQTRTQTVQQTRPQTVQQTRTQTVQQTRAPSPIQQTGRGMRTRRSAARSSSPVATPPPPPPVQPTRVSLPTRAAAAPSRAAAAAQMKAAAEAAQQKAKTAQSKPPAAPQKAAAVAPKAAVAAPKAIVAAPKAAAAPVKSAAAPVKAAAAPVKAAVAPVKAAPAPLRAIAAQPKVVPQSKVAPPAKTPAGKKVVTLTPVPPPPTRSTRQLRANDQAQQPINTRPSESNVEGGLATGGPSGTPGSARKVVVDLTSAGATGDDNRAAPDSREISFNKLQGKTYPSLVVVARPHLRAQDTTNDRPKLDAKVKSVLMHAPTKFTEWLIQQGLVRSEQKCSVHSTTQLKLGMYSDVYKFPYSGGYVWISECCPQRFVSVFSGSLFEGSPHPPSVILKLLYHWACQTNIQNVTQWVKVNNLYVKGMFTWLRSVCTVALQTHLRQLGGPGIKVEVGVISLGTTSQDGNQRQVKVEVLGILETNSKLIRLRAVEPQADGDRNYKKRFSKILEPIFQWVHPQSILVADLTVDKQTLHNMGFTNVIQSTSNEYGSNRQIMEYLRRIVPRMFQNTLSLLSRQIIQQFLDELVWREWFGTTPLQAFENVVIHLSEQTRYDTGQTLIVRLNKVAQNPFKSWGIPVNSTPASKTVDTAAIQQSTQLSTQQQQQQQKKSSTRFRKSTAQDGSQKSTPNAAVDISRPPKSTSPDVPEQMVPLENYYYGTIDTYSKTPIIVLNMKCPFCKALFDNNIQLMNHLFKHAHNVSQDAQLCRYCLTSVPTANDLLKHIASSHPGETKFDNGFVCLICETQYMNPFVLGKHMSKEHCPSELPYQCGTCGYRCSNHKQAIDHFYRAHDNGPTIQCPFCLKSTTVFSSSRNIHQNMNYFIQHLQKHQRKQFARRCGKCNLWFVQKDVLRDHQTRMHVSQRGKTGMVPWLAPRNGVMVPKSKMDKYPCDADVINFETLFFNIENNLTCKECNESMDVPKHFPSFESCQNPNCQYSTCCTNAMQEHNAKCNKSSNPVADEKLPFEMFCICGHSDKDGNQMARHLAICERKSAYPSRAKAKAATSSHSMLDVLGLVRKPEEGNSSGIKKRPRPEDSISESNEDVTVLEDSSTKTVTDEVKERTKRRRLLDVPKKEEHKIKIDEKKTKQNSVQADKQIEEIGDTDNGTSKDVLKQPKDVKKLPKELKNPLEEADVSLQSTGEQSEDVNEENKNMDKQPQHVKDPSEDVEEQSTDGTEPPKKIEDKRSKVDEDGTSEEVGDKASKEVKDETSEEIQAETSDEGKVEAPNEIEDEPSKDEKAKSPAHVENDSSKELVDEPSNELADEQSNKLVDEQSKLEDEPSNKVEEESSNNVEDEAFVVENESSEMEQEPAEKVEDSLPKEEVEDIPSKEIEKDRSEEGEKDEPCEVVEDEDIENEPSAEVGDQVTKLEEEPSEVEDEPSKYKDEPSGDIDAASKDVGERSNDVEETGPSSEVDEISSEVDEPSGKIDEPADEVDKPSGESDKPSSELDEPSSEVDEPSGEVDESSVKVEGPSGEVDEPFEVADESSGDVDQASKNVDDQSEDVVEHVEEPSKDVDELCKDTEETPKNTAELEDVEGNDDSVMAEEKEEDTKSEELVCTDSEADEPEEASLVCDLKQSDEETSLNESKIDEIADNVYDTREKDGSEEGMEKLDITEADESYADKDEPSSVTEEANDENSDQHFLEPLENESFEVDVSKKDEISENSSFANHLPALEEHMETSEGLPEKTRASDTEITSDDIQNLISDVVGAKSNEINFDDVQNMDEAPSMETETDLPNDQRRDQQFSQVDDISMESATDCIDNTVVMESGSMAMETD